MAREIDLPTLRRSIRGAAGHMLESETLLSGYLAAGGLRTDLDSLCDAGPAVASPHISDVVMRNFVDVLNAQSPKDRIIQGPFTKLVWAVSSYKGLWDLSQLGR